MGAEATGGRLKDARVLVTRPRERAAELCFLLEDEDAEVLFLPLLELAPPPDERPLAAAAEHLSRYAWVLFASPSAVQALMDAVRTAGTESRLALVKVGVVGPQTARAVRSYGLEVTLEAAQASGLGLLDALSTVLAPGAEVLLPVALEGRNELMQGLLDLGVAVTRVVAYQSQPVDLPAELWAEVRQRPPDAVLFASPRTVEAFYEAVGEDAGMLLSRTRGIAIGPTTARAMSERGVPATAVAEKPTAACLVDATARALGR